MFVNQNRRFGASGVITPTSGYHTPGLEVPHSDRLSFRNFVWAKHSDSQELLLDATTQCCPNSKMLWLDAKRFGVFLWLRSSELIVSHDYLLLMCT